MQLDPGQDTNRHREKLTRRSLLAAASAVVVASIVPATGAHAASTVSTGRLILLGTQGGPNFSLTRAEPANALVVGEDLDLIDCGYGARAGLLRAGLDLKALNAIFLTYLHDDHTSDLSAILTHLATQGRARDVVVYGPPGTDDLVTAIRAALSPNATIRVADEGRPDGFLSFIKSLEVEPGQELVLNSSLRVSSAENTHFPDDIGGLKN